jgi:bla regulator protein blaR1
MAWRNLFRRSCSALLLAWVWTHSQKAQPAQPEKAFDVASIKPNAGGGGRGNLGARPGGRFQVDNQTVRGLIQMAYNLRDFQISGGPPWIKSERYDIEAKAEGDPSRQQIEGPMLQALLKDRFQLKLHRETRELPVFGLVAAKGGPRLKPTKLEGDCAALYEKAKCADIRKGPSMLDVTAIRIEDFIEVLSSILGRVVINRTGFQGMFDAHLEFAPDDTAFAGSLGSVRASGGGRDGRGGGAVTSDRPPISTALQEQLGLRLESTKGPVEVVVVDSVDRPSVN